MSRHRNIRNAKSYDYDDDYDVYGQSFEEDYGVSPGTMAQYSYPRSSCGNQFGTFMPSEAPLEEDVWLEEVEEKLTNSPLGVPVLNIVHSSDQINLCAEAIRDVVGENYSEDLIKKAAVMYDLDAEKALNYLLNVPQKSKLSSTDSVTESDHQKKQNSDSKKIKDSNKQEKEFFTRPKKQTNHNQVGTTLIVTTSNNKSAQNELSITTAKKGEANTPIKTGFSMPSTQHAKSSKLNNDTNEEANNLLKVGANSNLLLTPTRKGVENPELGATPGTPGRNKITINYEEEYSKRQKDEKKHISMVVIGHVDAGKSTMMGHVLFQKGIVSKRIIHKYEQESKKMGKSSFAFAWVLDETGEERIRGVTMDVAQNKFETDHRIITLMDAPGHRDFIPNMITGASQADVATLVVGASTGEFEAGFGVGGQTREHALLVRSLGVSQLAVAVNKLDTVNWSQKRFDEIVAKLKQFLKQAGFRDSDVTYVPVSGLLGENLVTQSKVSELLSWYKGPYLLQVINEFRTPQRPVEYPLRFCLNDVFKGQGSGIFLSGKIEAGGVCPNTKVIVMPAGEKGLIKQVESNEGGERLEFALAGEHVTLVLNGVDAMKVTTGSIVCNIENPIRAVTRIQARIIVFNIEVPITRGFPVELHCKSVYEPAVIRRLLSKLHKSTGEVVAKKPKLITKGQNALVEVEVARPLCLEEYSNLKELGRFTLRYGGSTIAACVVTQLLR